MNAEERIFLWDAGPACGTAASPEGAFRKAAPYLAAGAEGLVEEAEVALLPAGGGGFTPQHRRTGKAWRWRLKDGCPSWERQADEGGQP